MKEVFRGFVAGVASAFLYFAFNWTTLQMFLVSMSIITVYYLFTLPKDK